ncbi:MAG: DUF11 domain-containing protein [Nitrosomonadales bacterium]|nr:DUF11 domain-containing protein [Nitrosomonadales bacterium]
MRISRLLSTANLLVLLCGFSLGAQAADGAIKVKSVAEIEVTMVAKDGKKTVKRASPDKAVPGTEVIFTNTFENTGDKTASDITVENPIPANTEYVGGSAFGKDCVILFSVDGGMHYGYAEDLKIKDEKGNARNALPREYTHIRWTYKGQLAGGKSGEVGFRATIK